MVGRATVYRVMGVRVAHLELLYGIEKNVGEAGRGLA